MAGGVGCGGGGVHLSRRLNISSVDTGMTNAECRRACDQLYFSAGVGQGLCQCKSHFAAGVVADEAYAVNALVGGAGGDEPALA